MKRVLTVTALLLITSIGFAQTVDLRKKIEVTGTAEAEVTPDILYVVISLKEYPKDSRTKVSIEMLEGQLQAAVAAAGIPRENFMINNVSSYNWTSDKKKDPTFLARKQYSLKVTDLNKFNSIISAVDQKGIESTGIEKYDYSKIEELRKELKVKAIVAAREKAAYLTAAIRQSVGSALEIQEVNNDAYPQPMYRMANVAMALDSNAGGEPIDFKKIKLSAQIRAVFEIN